MGVLKVKRRKYIKKEGIINSVNCGTSWKIRTENQPVNLAEWRSLVTFSRKFQQSDGEILTEKGVEEEGNYSGWIALENFDHSGSKEMGCSSW